MANFFDCVREVPLDCAKEASTLTKYEGEYTTERFKLVTYVSDGQEVYAPFMEKGDPSRLRLLKCKVACAAGTAARVVNERHEVDTWFELWQLRNKG